MVDIEAWRKLYKTVGIPRRIWVMKYRHGMMGTGRYTKIWRQANDDCDTEAKALWQDEDDKGTKVISMELTDKSWALYIGDENISTQVIVTMYNHTHDPQAVRKWQECGVDNKELRDMMDIEARRKAVNAVGIPR
jgi:hypothetical protein